MSSPPIIHEIREDENGEHRPMTHAYSVVYLKGCESPSVEVMTLNEIRAIRDRSKSANSGPWQTDFEEMARKTVFRRHAKVLPMSAELAHAMDTDGDQIDLTAAARVQPTASDDIAPKTQDTTAETIPQEAAK